MKASSIRFPWKKTEKGQGFFVPCLDADAVRELGLKKAVLNRILDARAYAAVLNGRAGVWFYRRPPSQTAHTKSSSDEARPASPASQ
jgi:hypothetical protein